VPDVSKSAGITVVSEPLADEVRALITDATGACESVATPSAGTAAAYFSGSARALLRGVFDVEGLRRLVPPTVLHAGAAVVAVLTERGQCWEDGVALRAAALEAVRRGTEREAVRLALVFDAVALLAHVLTPGPPVPSALRRVRERLDAARAVEREVRAGRRGRPHLRRVK
jgi:hypothetical protein